MLLKKFFATSPSVNKPVTADVPFRVVLQAFESEELLPYAKNRGTQKDGKLKVNPKVYKEMLEQGIDSIKIGTITIAEDNGKYRIADGHSRIIAASKLFQGEDEEVITNQLKDVIVSVKLVHKTEHLKAYQYANLSKAHSGRDKVLNTDFVAGRTVSNLLKKVGIEDFHPRLWQPFFDILFTANMLYRQSANNKIPEITMEDVRSRSVSASKYKDMIVTDNRALAIMGDVALSLEQALDYYNSVLTTSDGLLENEKITPELHNLIRQGGFMSFIVLDSLSNGRVVANKPAALLAKMGGKNYLTCETYLSEVARRNKAIEATKKLTSTLALRKHK